VILENKNIFLFSIDLEDVRDAAVNGRQYKDRVEVNTRAYLAWLKSNNFRCTFFVVGSIGERYRDLLKEIIKDGHEIACHTYGHKPLDNFTPDEFKHDLENNINALIKAGAREIHGFRAPIFSLTEKTSWAYKILSDAGITYSSSVLPAANPLYGWQSFGQSPRKATNEILELPITLDKFGPLNIPFGGGVYFRCLPFFLVKNAFVSRFKLHEPVLGYFHPYDLDPQQEKFMHGGINNSRFYNFLMYYNRRNLIKRLNKILDLKVSVIPFGEYVNNELKHGI
jgi:polysaccharide deacetylase family protein (PEP-CTERM system associated)